MPVDIITNSVSAVGSLAFLLNPTPAPTVKAEASEAPRPPATTLLGDWGGWRSRATDQGFTVTAQYIGEVAGNVSGGSRRGTVYNGLMNLAGDVDLEKLAGWNGGLFHAALLYPHGKSLTDKYVNDLFVLSNLDASDAVRLFELWLEQGFAEGKFSVRAGQIAVDQEFAYTDQGALFNNSAFGWFPIVGATAPVYPQGAPGIRLRWQPKEAFYFQFAVVDGDVNPTDASGRETNPHGVEFRFNEGAFLIAEGSGNWSLAENTKPGTLKFGGWYHTAKTGHLRFDDGGLSLADPLSSGVPAQRGDNWGIYLGIEQVLWREHPEETESTEGVGIFGRCGYAPGDRNALGLYLETGVTWTGLVPGRDQDVCGFGIAHGRMSHALHDLVADANFYNATTDPLPDHETVLEAEYQFNLRPGFAIQPGAQYIIHPGGSGLGKDALVFSIRSIMEF